MDTVRRQDIEVGGVNDELQIICDVIRSNVSAYEVGKLLGLAPKHDGRCRCFFHGGDHRNLKLYGPGRGYYCFVCHAHGDVISLVKEYTQCSFIEAIAWINDAFDMGLDLRRDSFQDRRRRAERYARNVAGGNESC